MADHAPSVDVLGSREHIMAAVDPQPEYQVTARLAGAPRPDSRIVVDLEARHGQALFGFVRRLGLSDSQAADCVQEAMLRLWAELDRGTVIVEPKGWAFRTAYRIAMDEHRLQRRLAALAGLLAARTQRPSAQLDQADRLAVWSEIDRLPVRQRQVLYLRFRADLPFDQIGETLGITASAARSHATQATSTLRRRLAVEDPMLEAR
jgi:RNA polymerase sigma-70 factor (ECF subfamily)